MSLWQLSRDELFGQRRLLFELFCARRLFRRLTRFHRHGLKATNTTAGKCDGEPYSTVSIAADSIAVGGCPKYSRAKSEKANSASLRLPTETRGRPPSPVSVRR